MSKILKLRDVEDSYDLYIRIDEISAIKVMPVEHLCSSTTPYGGYSRAFIFLKASKNTVNASMENEKIEALISDFYNQDT